MKKIREFTKRHRKVLGGLMIALAVVLMFSVINNPLFVSTAATTRELPIYSVERDDKCIALSFDAAWGNEDTELLIEILDTYDIKATFFLVGEWVDKFPESVLALSEAGMEVMNHSDDHEHFTKLSTDEIIANVTACNEKIEAITGVSPTLFRCPYGEYDDNVVLALSSIGITTVQWDVDSLDWKGLSAAEITERVVSNAQDGSIVLFHNAAENTPEALPDIIEALLADGYEIITVGEILLDGDKGTDYDIDHTGRQFSLK